MTELRRALIAVGPDLALFGVIFTLVISLVSVAFYNGAAGESYSPLNHTVSELGERGVSELAGVFNLGLVTGGSLIAIYMLSLALRFESRSGRGFGLLGMAAGLAMVLVGLFPVDDLEPHVLMAAMAFLLILATTSWFAVWSLRGSAPYPHWLGWFATTIVVLVLVFLLVPNIIQPQYTFEMEFSTEVPRPEVWLNSTFEWIVVVAAWAWIAAIAIHDRHR